MALIIDVLMDVFVPVLLVILTGRLLKGKLIALPLSGVLVMSTSLARINSLDLFTHQGDPWVWVPFVTGNLLAVLLLCGLYRVYLRRERATAE